MGYKPRICKICGSEFTPTTSKQLYCKKDIEKICPVCGDIFTVLCSPSQPTTCSKPGCKKKAGYLRSIAKKKICKICGQEFVGTSSTQEYCNKPVSRICKVCGKEFTIKCTAEEYKKQTCSKECMDKLACDRRQEVYQATHIRKCSLCGKEFRPRTNTQKVCEGKHFRTCIVCGKEFELNYKSAIGNVDLRKTCSEECRNKHISDVCVFKLPEIKEKIKNTMLTKYGVPYPGQSPELQARMKASYLARTGYDHPSHNPNTLKGKNLQVSSLEQKLSTVLSNNKIKFETQYMVSKEGLSHAFDFYLPDHNTFIDVDGVYYHGYLDDSNGLQIDEIRDAVRVKLIDPGYYYFVVIESEFNKSVDNLLMTLREINENTFHYDEYMFRWCRSIEFPYPDYDEKRLKRDLNNLRKVSCISYNPASRLGISTIRYFHKSIYDAKVGNSPSLKEAWYNDAIMKRVIHNRMIYKNNVDPSKILAGFYISKIVPKVSIFNPVLAKYLTCKYLSSCDNIVDPFSGFSGRLLGVSSTGKRYFGFDLNSKAVLESNQIIKFHQLIDCSVTEQNVLDYTGSEEYDGLLTCPPYGTKETYSIETEYKTCDDWIELVLSKFNCNRYVFVIDATYKYMDNVVEIITTKSYLNTVDELVVVIDR